MDRMLYVAMTGAKQTLVAQTATTHNLANASTTGFLADLESFRAMPVYGPGHPTRVYAMAERPGVDYAHGTQTATGRDLDVSVNGNGWIAIEARDGSEAYTRAGDLRVAADGFLVNGAGYRVLGNAGPISIPQNEKIDIGVDGTISLRPLGQAPNTLSAADRIKLVSSPNESMVKGADGLIRTRTGEPLPQDENMRVTPGSLETSNVSAVEAMVNLITLSRQFEMQVKAMHTTQENDQSAQQLLRIN